MADNESDEALTAVAMVTAALMIDQDKGEESADQLSLITLSTAFDKKEDPPYVAQTFAYLASYAAVLLNMLGEVLEEEPTELHQSMALAISASEETA